MQWSSDPAAGFTRGRPWLPVQHQETLNVSAESGQDDSHLGIHRRMLLARRQSDALRLGDIRFISGWATPNPLVFERICGDDRAVVALNLSGGNVSVDLGVRGTVVAGTEPRRWDCMVGPELTLGPWEAVVIR